MIRNRRWHFVNGDGEPLDARYDTAAPHIENYFSKNFPCVDPADLDDVIESSATRQQRICNLGEAFRGGDVRDSIRRARFEAI
jgi:hypothetical protein